MSAFKKFIGAVKKTISEAQKFELALIMFYNALPNKNISIAEEEKWREYTKKLNKELLRKTL